jgi:hypothetical protein
MAAEFTLDEKLEVIETFITQWRCARNGATGERDVFLILKAIASDIRARKPAAPGRARDRLSRAISDAKDLKVETGYRVKDLRKIAEIVIGEWPVIRTALEQLEQQQGSEA